MPLVKRIAKGTAVAQSVSGAFVAMAGLTSIDIASEKSVTVETLALDGGTYITFDPNGHSQPPVIKLSGFYDPVHATYTAFEPLIATPVATSFKVTYTDSAPTVKTYNGTGFAIEKKIEAGKFAMANLEIQTSGAPS